MWTELLMNHSHEKTTTTHLVCGRTMRWRSPLLWYYRWMLIGPKLLVLLFVEADAQTLMWGSQTFSELELEKVGNHWFNGKLYSDSYPEQTLMHAHTLICTHTHTEQTHKHSCTKTHTHPKSCTQTPTHTDTHTHIHSCTQTHTHTHTHSCAHTAFCLDQGPAKLCNAWQKVSWGQLGLRAETN